LDCTTPSIDKIEGVGVRFKLPRANAGAMTRGGFNNAARGKNHSGTIVYVRSRAGALRETPRRLRRH
jgi:hypothetical protein